MTTVTLNLRDILRRRLDDPIVLAHATVDVEELLHLYELGEFEEDVHDLLAKQRLIALIWSIEDVQDRRPDLNEAQAWQVLQACQRMHDRNHGLTWETIDAVADIEMGLPNAVRVGRCDRAIVSYGDDLPEGNLIDFITDARHWCAARGHNFDELLRLSKQHHEAEADEQ